MNIPGSSGFMPPKQGTPVPYTCTNCGHTFTQKKQLLPLPVKCPKCGSMKCISVVSW